MDKIEEDVTKNNTKVINLLLYFNDFVSKKYLNF